MGRGNVTVRHADAAPGEDVDVRGLDIIEDTLAAQIGIAVVIRKDEDDVRRGGRNEMDPEGAEEKDG